MSNNLSSLDVSNHTKLETLYCGDNDMSNLNVTGCSKLETMDCFSNKLSSLDISSCSALKELVCSFNYLPDLDVSHNKKLERLVCYNDQMHKLDVSQNRALKELFCGNNYFKSLNLHNNKALEKLYCDNNYLTSLDLSQNTALKYIDCVGRNKLNTYAIDKLLCSLPNKAVSDTARIYLLYDAADRNYANVIASDKQNAIDKNWKVWYLDYNGPLKDTDIPATTGDYDCDATVYDIRIAGQQVDGNNASDLSVIDGVQGKVSYDPSTKTLTLDNATIIASELNQTPLVANSKVKGLTIKLIGNNILKYKGGQNTNRIILDLRSSTTITSESNGKLTITSTTKGTNIGVLLSSSSTVCTIKDCQVDIVADVGIMSGLLGGKSSLVIDNATVKVKGEEYGSIGELRSLTLRNGCAITSPAGAIFDKSKGAVTDGSGNIIKERVIIKKVASGIDDTYIQGIEVYPNPVSDILNIDIAESEFEVNIYNIQGQLVHQEHNSTSISVETLPVGVYTLKITTAKGIFRSKFVKR